MPGFRQPPGGNAECDTNIVSSVPVPVTDNGGSLTVDGTVAVSNFPATQPISGSVTVSGTVTANAGTGTLAVSGPVTDAQLRASAVPVSGPLTDAQLRATPVPVSGTVTATPTGTQAVSGTFWQATQPVSIASMPSTPVTGTFWQATQPVSGPLTDAQLRAAAVPVSGTFWQVTQPVSGTFWQATQPVSGPLTDAQLRAAAVTVKEPKDTSRSQVCLAWEEMAGTANVESSLTNFTSGTRAGSALSAANKLAVTSGKTLRIQTVYVYVKATSTVNNLARFRIRQAASSVANNSPIILDAVLALEVTGTIAANAFHGQQLTIPDGLEVASTQEITFTWLTAANTCTVGMTILGYEYTP